MLCRSIAVKGLENIKDLIKGAELAEIRLEHASLTILQVKELFSSHPNLIATCRPELLSNNQRRKILMEAIDGGAKWIDLEIESEKAYLEELTAYAKKKGCQVIISYHNYEITPDSKILYEIIKEAQQKNADLIKIATMVNSVSDAARLLGLYEHNYPLLAIGMGEMGKITRLAAIKLGAPFTFVSSEMGQETAPGQINEDQMKNLIKYL